MRKNSFGGGDRKRSWTELRIRRAELVKDNVTLPIQRLREAVSDLIKASDDKEIGQELLECNRRLGELKLEVVEFLAQSAEDHVYWVERTGKAHRTLALNAAPVDVAGYLRRRLFETDTSVIMTSATLATKVVQVGRLPSARFSASRHKQQKFGAWLHKRAGGTPALLYFAKRVGWRSRHPVASRHALRLRAADETLHRPQNARPARTRLRRCFATLD